MSDYKGTIIFLHGIESHSGWFSTLAQLMSENGFKTICYDRPGWGVQRIASKAKNPSTAFHFEAPDCQLEATLAELLKIIDQECSTHGPSHPVHVVGLSWGALFLWWADAIQKIPADRIKTLVGLSPVLVPLRDFTLTQKMRIAFVGILGFLGLNGRQKWSVIQLPWKATDFSDVLKNQKFIADDPLRTTYVDARFLLRTKVMQWIIAAKSFSKTYRPRLVIVLPERDAIADLKETRAIAARTSTKVVEIPNSGHSVVLDAPEAVAQFLSVQCL